MSNSSSTIPTVVPHNANAIATYTIFTIAGTALLVGIVLGLRNNKICKYVGVTIQMVVEPNKNAVNLRPIGLFCLRMLALGFAGGTMVYALANGQELYFYTLWNYGLLCFYFLLHAFIFPLHYFGILAKNPEVEYVFSQAATIVFETVMSMCLLVDTVYWGLLYGVAPNPSLISYTTVTMHAMNFPIMIIEMSLNSLHFRPFDVFFVLAWGMSWMFFQWIYESQTGLWIYYFTNVGISFSTLWYIGLFAYHIVTFYILFGFYKLKMLVLHEQPYYENEVSTVKSKIQMAPFSESSTVVLVPDSSKDSEPGLKVPSGLESQAQSRPESPGMSYDDKDTKQCISFT